MLVAKINEDQVKELSNQGFKAQKHNLSAYEKACYDTNTVSELINDIDVSFCNDNWPLENGQWTEKMIKESHKNVIEYAMYVA